MKTISREEFENRTYLERVRRIQDLHSRRGMVSGRRKRGMRKMIFHFSNASFGITDYL